MQRFLWVGMGASHTSSEREGPNMICSFHIILLFLSHLTWNSFDSENSLAASLDRFHAGRIISPNQCIVATRNPRD